MGDHPAGVGVGILAQSQLPPLLALAVHNPVKPRLQPVLARQLLNAIQGNDVAGCEHQLFLLPQGFLEIRQRRQEGDDLPAHVPHHPRHPQRPRRHLPADQQLIGVQHHGFEEQVEVFGQRRAQPLVNEEIALIAGDEAVEPAPDFQFIAPEGPLRGADDLVLVPLAARALEVAQADARLGPHPRPLDGVQFVMGAVVRFQRGAGRGQRLRVHGEHQPLAVGERHRKVGEDVAGLDVVQILGGPVKLGILAGRAQIAAAVPPVAPGHDKIAILIMAAEKLIQAVQHLPAIQRGGRDRRLPLPPGAIVVNQSSSSRDAGQRIQTGVPLLRTQARLEAQLLFQFGQPAAIFRDRLGVGVPERLGQQLSQSPASKRFAARFGDDLAQKSPHFAVVAANQPVQAKIQGLGLVQLEQLGHQFDETGLGLKVGHLATLFVLSIFPSLAKEGWRAAPWWFEAQFRK